jgi:hypothetical protein
MFKSIFNFMMMGSLVLVSTSSLAKTLATYEEIADSLEAGQSVLLNFKPEKCKVTPEPSKEARTDRMAIKLKDLVEWHSAMNGGKSMRVLGVQEGGLFGDKRFDYYRNLTLVYEDGTVMVIADHVDPVSFKLETREQVVCRLSADGSGGVVATELSHA